MREFEKKKEVINDLLYKLENDYTKKYLKSILCDLERYEQITRHKCFYLQDAEAEQAEAFYDKFVSGRNFGAIGGGMTYSFTPTGLGDVVQVSTIDDKGEIIKEDITDNSHW